MGVTSRLSSLSTGFYTRAFMLLSAVWMVVVLLTVGSLMSPRGGGGTTADQEALLNLINSAVDQMAQLQRQNAELRSTLRDLTLAAGNETSDGHRALVRLREKLTGLGGDARAPLSAGVKREAAEPSSDYELGRRQVRRDVDELWRYVDSQLTRIQEGDTGGVSADFFAQQTRESLAEYDSVLHADMANMTAADGWQAWRQTEADRLAKLVRRRIDYLQNPPDCRTARKLVCNLNKVCGFGCQFHHVTYCLIMAYATERTLVLRSTNWRYNKAGWERVFQPLSSTCTNDKGATTAPWPGTADTQVITLPIVDVIRPKPDFLPLSVPRDLSERLLRLHGNPSVWFIAQFVAYLYRPQPNTQRVLERFTDTLALSKPCVGIQVRRTDKVGSEAAFHSIEEYMRHVETFYRRYEMTNGPVKRRCVFLASDDPSVFPDAVQKYPQYRIVGDPSIARSAAVSSRYTETSLLGVISDIHALSLCDYLVCTFSSQVCRVGYELMQTRHVDAADWFHSLDDMYYYGGQLPHEQTVRVPHQSESGHELQLFVGDTVGIAGNHWNGYSKGQNRRTGKVGLYPAYKALEKYRIIDFPTYPNVSMT